jgi:hypothetical protein
LLISSGPEFAGPESIYRTPLAQLLPVQPTGAIFTQPFKPVVTEDGLAHPVTRELAGRNQDKTPPSWGRWFRILGANKVSGQTVMAGDGAKPLLVLDRVGKGRIAELMSDQTHWGTRFEGGGPQANYCGACALADEGTRAGSENLSAQIIGDRLRSPAAPWRSDPPVTLHALANRQPAAGRPSQASGRPMPRQANGPVPRHR